MPYLSDDEYRDLFEKIIIREVEIREELKELRNKSHEVARVEKLLKERIDLATSGEKIANTVREKLLFTIMKDSAIQDEKFYKTEKQFNEEISRIYSRLDDLEEEVKKLKG